MYVAMKVSKQASKQSGTTKKRSTTARKLTRHQ